MTEFEAWYLIEMVACCGKSVLEQAEKNLAWRREDGSYADPTLRLASLAWQASRAALVIELPQGGYFAGYDNEHMMESRDVREAIETAGLKVQP